MTQGDTPQHEQLIQAGWSYDQATDQYREPGASEGERAYSLQEAVQRQQQRMQEGQGQQGQQGNKRQ